MHIQDPISLDRTKFDRVTYSADHVALFFSDGTVCIFTAIYDRMQTVKSLEEIERKEQYQLGIITQDEFYERKSNANK